MADETQATPESFPEGTSFFPIQGKEMPKPDIATNVQTQPVAEPSSDQDAFPKGTSFFPMQNAPGQLRSKYDSEDFAKGATSGIYEGVTRLPAMASSLIRSGIDEVAYLGFKKEEEAGKIPSADEAYADYKLAQEQAAEQSFLKKIPEAAEKYLPSYGYEPTTRAGALAKEATAGAAETVMLPFLGSGGILARGVTGAASGALGEGLRQKFEGTPLEPWAQFGGALAGQILGELGTSAVGAAAKGYKVFGAQKELDSALADALEYDLKNNLTKISPEDLQSKLKSGEPINVGEVLSPESKTFSVLQKLAGNVPGKKSNEMVAQKLLSLSNNGIMNYGDLTKILDSAATKEADRVFDIARAAPSANDITIKDIGLLINAPQVQAIMKEVSDLAKLPAKEGHVIAPPSIIPGKPAIPARSEATGLVDEFGKPITREIPGTPEVPEQFIGGNLNFWQKVKEGLGRKFGETGEPAFLEAKNNLIKSLSNKVPEYGEALSATAKSYGDLDAANAGYNFMKNIGIKKAEDIKDLMKKMDETQIKNFQDGALANIYEKAGEDGGIRYLVNQINAPNSKFSYKLKEALGPEKYDQVAGSIIQQSMLNNATNTYEHLLKFGTEVVKQKGLALGAAGALTAAAGYMAGADVDKSSAIAGISLLLGGRQLAMNSLEKKIAPLALEAIRSPDGGRQLLKLMEKAPEARTLYDKIQAGLLRAALAGGRSVGLSSQESPEPLQPVGMPSPNAHGGRIAYKSGGRVKNARSVAEALMREIDQTRKLIGKKTEDILSMPDDAVATALKIARGNV